MTVQLPFTTLDVFTTTRYEGNPLAVVHVPSNLAQQLTTAQLDQIAKEFNLSETIFIYLDDESADGKQERAPEWKVRIFTTEGEIPFAGTYNS
jgi:PhzF family phenazine biosynthesis protein